MPPQMLASLEISYLSIADLNAYPQNARTHSKHQIKQIAESIREFGYTSPVLINSENTIIAGHGRVAAAKLLGMEAVPTIRLDHLSQEQLQAYVIADNKIAQNAGWDREILAIELQHLLSIEGGLEITVTGFEIPEIDLILEEASQNVNPEDELPSQDGGGPVVTQTGDLWLLGKHRLLCGSALRREAFTQLLGRHRAGVVFTDPPYNVRIDGNVCGKGSIQHREFGMASGEMSESEFVAFLTASLGLLAQFSSEGSVHFIFMDWRHVRELSTVGQGIYDSLLNLCVWVKDNGGMGSFYRSRHELVFVYRNGKRGHRNNIQLGKFGRNRTNIWEYPGVNTLSKQSDEGNLLAMHPTVKPVALVADALLDCSARGDLVVDAYLGSGTTLMAAERVGRICYGMEIDSQYVDLAVRRWQHHTGEYATHSETGKKFDEVAEACEVANG